MADTTIKIKRRTDSTPPTSLALGELAYSEESNKLYIGTEGDPVEVRPEFLTLATDSNSDKISLDDGSGNTYSFDTSALSAGDIEYKFPVAKPIGAVGENKALMSSTDGQLTYGSISVGTLESIANVEADPQGNEVLVYSDTGSWVGTDPATLTDDLGIESNSNQTYNNLTLSGNLDVKGNSLQLNTSQLQIKDKSLGVGVSGDVYTTSVNMTGGIINFLQPSDIIATANVTGYNNIHTHTNDTYTSYTFTEDGDFSTDIDLVADILVVAGGGGGGSHIGGGGGGGGMITASNYTIPAGIHSIQIGAGGLGSTHTNSTGTNGGNTIFGSLFTAIGGGYGGSGFDAGNSGGSGGGGGHGMNNSGLDNNGGAGTAGQGSNGGSGSQQMWGGGGGGGGGAAASGSDCNLGGPSGAGGAGQLWNLDGLGYYYAGGGGGGSKSMAAANGGIGGGGGGTSETHSTHGIGGGSARNNGGAGGGDPAGNGGANTGGGGGGGGHSSMDGGAGGSGIVVINILSSSTSSGPGIGDKLFVGDGNDNIPTGYHTLAGTTAAPTITITNSTTTVNDPFDLTLTTESTDAQVDGAGLVFPGDTEKSLKWNDTNDNFQLTGGDLKVTSNEVNVNGTKIIDDNTKTIDTEITFNQITGAFSGGEYS